MRPRLALAAVVAVSTAVNAWGLQWGLPSEYGWAPDEVLPAAVLTALGQGFGHGWYSKYPPLHFVVLAAAYAPALALTGLGVIDGSEAGRSHALMVTGRLVSLAMGAGILVVLYRIARTVADELVAVLACALFATSLPFVYYAKVANLDVPYLFWFSLAVLFYVRALERHWTRDYVAFALAAAASVATKDQAYALYVLPALVLALELHRERRRAGASAVPPLIVAAAAGLGAFALFDNVLLNPAGFSAHVRLITGTASRDFRMFPASLTGEATLAGQTLRHLRFALGWPAFGVCVAGLAGTLAQARAHRRLALTLAFPLSYAVFFLAVVLYTYDRFVLPIALVLAPFGGAALARSFRAQRGAGGLLTASVLAYGLAYGLSVDVLMARDSRYEAERWLARAAGPTAAVAAVGPLEYLPRMDGLRWRRLGPAAARLAQVRPELVVVNGDYAMRADAGSGERAFYDGLDDGSLGYELAFRHRTRPRLSLIDTEELQKDGPHRIWSNLDKVDPEIRAYRRKP
jgi:hypothetical protein